MALRRVWGRLDHRQRHWVFNILLGVFIAFGLSRFENQTIVVAAQNWATDSAMRSGVAIHGWFRGNDPPVPLAFIDVDEETWRSDIWDHGEPFHAPRDRLLDLIKYALGHARYVVLDIIIEAADNEDEWFAKQIAALTPRLKPDQHIIFVRTLRQPLNGRKELLAPEIHSSKLSEVIDKHPDHLHAAAPYFRVSRDGILRDWQLWQVGCGHNAKTADTGLGQWEMLPSVQLLVGALWQTGKKPDEDRSAMRAKFPWRHPVAVARCVTTLDAYAEIGVPVAQLKPDDAPIWKWLRNDSGLGDRSALERPDNGSTAKSDRIFFRFRYGQSPVQLIPALAILDHTSPAKLADDGVVVIGQSFEAARDEHETPLGPMSGPMVLINSINSMLNPGLLQAPGFVVKWLIEGCAIVVIGYLLASQDYLLVFLTILLLIPALIFFNYWLLLGGIWVDFAVPLLGISAHWIIVEIQAYQFRRRPPLETHVSHRGIHVQHKGED